MATAPRGVKLKRFMMIAAQLTWATVARSATEPRHALRSMALRRVFVDRVDAGRAALNGDRAHHLSRVARLQEGEEVEASDGERLFLATVSRAGRTSVELEIKRQLLTPRPGGRSIRLEMAIFKFARLEWLIEKVTEIGVAAIVPIVAERSGKNLVEAAPKRSERWRRIAEEAALQSRRMAPPAIEPAVAFDKLISGVPATESKPALRLILDPGGRQLKDELTWWVRSDSAVEASLLVGPEGGWTESELSAAQAKGYVPVSIGRSILRAETAALSAFAVIAHLLQPAPPAKP